MNTSNTAVLDTIHDIFAPVHEMVRLCTLEASKDIIIEDNEELVCMDAERNRHTTKVYCHWFTQAGRTGYITLSGRVVERLPTGEQKVLPFGGSFRSKAESEFQKLQGWRA